MTITSTDPLLSPTIIALGGNIAFKNDHPVASVTAALDLLKQVGLPPVAVSRFYRTPCFPAGAGPDYVNAAAILDYGGGARDLMTKLHKIEAQMGRERLGRWARRTLDLDLIAMGQQVLPDAATQGEWRALSLADQMTKTPGQMILPHPRMQDRGFVLIPLLDITPDWRHPTLGLTVREMAENLSETATNEVVALT